MYSGQSLQRRHQSNYMKYYNYKAGSGISGPAFLEGIKYAEMG